MNPRKSDVVRQSAAIPNKMDVSDMCAVGTLTKERLEQFAISTPRPSKKSVRVKSLLVI